MSLSRALTQVTPRLIGDFEGESILMIYSLAFVITGDYGDGQVVANTSSINLEGSTTHDNEKSEKSCEPDKRDGSIFEIKLELEDDSSNTSMEAEDEIVGESQESESKSTPAIPSQIDSELPASKSESDLVDQKERLGWTRESPKAEKKKLLFHLPEAQDLQEAMSNPHVIPRVSYGYMIAMALQVMNTNYPEQKCC